MGCNNKISQKCGTVVYSPCVKYELEVPEISSLYEEGCLSIEDTTKDLYNLVEDVYEGINLSGLGTKCLSYVPAAKVKDILIKYEEEICTLKTKVETLETTAICDMLITSCGLDLTGISDQCDNPVRTVGELFNYILTQINT